jgi:D-alanyl-D-alanine carboxypeptidase
MRFPRFLAAAVALVAAVVAIPATSPSPVAGVGPLPACRLDDILTEPRGYDDWAITQVDWILTLGPNYKPPDLVSVRESGIAGGGNIRKVAIDDLTALVKAAKANGTPLVAWSPYRSYKQQTKLFNGYAGWTGTKYTNFDSAITYSARPGHSEHQTGLTIDFVAVGDTGLTSNWEVTKTGKWMANHAWEYGWVMSYPKDKQDVTCYRYEPWHYRYLGRDLAKQVHDSGLTIREYLWANYTQVDPSCVALPAPSLGGPARSCAFPASTEAAATLAPPDGGSQAPPGPTPDGASSVPPTNAPAAAPVTAPAGTWFGLDPIVVLALAALVVAVGGLAYSLRRARRR